MGATVGAKEWPLKQLGKNLSSVSFMTFSMMLLVLVAAPYCSDVPLSLPEGFHAVLTRPHLHFPY